MSEVIPAPPPFASQTRAGIVSTGNQTFAGNKTFDGLIGLAQKNIASRPAATGSAGSVVYDSDTGNVMVSDGTRWYSLGDSRLLNVRDFGAKGDNVADDTNAFLAAIEASRPLQRPVLVPPGTYRINQPLVLDYQGAGLIGMLDNTNATKLAPTYNGVQIWVGSAKPDPLQLVSPLVPSSTGGMAVDLTGTANSVSSPYFDLRDSSACELNGRSRITFRMFIKRTGSTRHGVVFSGRCAAKKQDTDAFSVRLFIYQDGTINAQIRTTGGQFTLTTPNGVLPNDGNTHHLQFTYDGSKLGVAVDGIWVGQTTATGTIIQKKYEPLTIFREQSRPGYQGYNYGAPQCIIQSLQMTMDVYTVGTNFTPPTSEHVHNGNNEFLLNFSTGSVVGGRLYKYQGRNLGTLWMPIRGSNGAAVGYNTIANMSLGSNQSQALYINGSTQSVFSNLYMLTGNGVEIADMGFLNMFYRVKVTFGLSFGFRINSGGGVNQYVDCDSFGGSAQGYAAALDTNSMCFHLIGSSANLVNCYLGTRAWGFFAHAHGGQQTVNMSHCVFTDENETYTPDAAIYVEETPTFTMNSGTVEVKFKVVDGLIHMAGGVRAVWNGTIFTINKSSTKVFRTYNTSTGVPSNTVIECNRWVGSGGASEAQVPWGDNVTMITGGKVTGLVGLSSTSVRANNLSGKTQILAGTSAMIITFPVDEPDTNYRIALSADAPGVYWTNKTVSGFTVTTGSTVASTINVEWIIAR